MEKIVERERKEIWKYHEFYCDSCGKKIGESVEADDGYFE